MEMTDEILEKLNGVTDPCSEAYGYELGIVGMGLVSKEKVQVSSEKVVIQFRLTSPSCMMIHYFIEEIHECLDGMGFDEIQVEFDDGMAWEPEMMSTRARTKMKQTPLDT